MLGNEGRNGFRFICPLLVFVENEGLPLLPSVIRQI
jgi:hypothetical protein